MSEEKKQLTYADAGVDIDAGNKAVELMKDSVRATSVTWAALAACLL